MSNARSIYTISGADGKYRGTITISTVDLGVFAKTDTSHIRTNIDISQEEERVRTSLSFKDTSLSVLLDGFREEYRSSLFYDTFFRFSPDTSSKIIERLIQKQRVTRQEYADLLAAGETDEYIWYYVYEGETLKAIYLGDQLMMEVPLIHRWADITGKPTTIAGYGIRDAYNKTEVNSFISRLESVDKGFSDAILDIRQQIKGTGIYYQGAGIKISANKVISIDDDYIKSFIPEHEGYATKDWVNSEIRKAEDELSDDIARTEKKLQDEVDNTKSTLEAAIGETKSSIEQTRTELEEKYDENKRLIEAADQDIKDANLRIDTEHGLIEANASAIDKANETIGAVDVKADANSASITEILAWQDTKAGEITEIQRVASAQEKKIEDTISTLDTTTGNVATLRSEMDGIELKIKTTIETEVKDPDSVITTQIGTIIDGKKESIITGLIKSTDILDEDGNILTSKMQGAYTEWGIDSVKDSVSSLTEEQGILSGRVATTETSINGFSTVIGDVTQYGSETILTRFSSISTDIQSINLTVGNLESGTNYAAIVAKINEDKSSEVMLSADKIILSGETIASKLTAATATISNLTLTNASVYGTIASGSGDNPAWILKPDGSGSLASGNISWTTAGVLNLGSDTTVGAGGISLGTLSALASLFELKTDPDGGQYVHVKNNYGFASDSYVSAGGLSTTGGSGSGGALYLLSDVLSDGSKVLGAKVGSLLSFDGSHWKAIDQSSITPDLSGFYTKTETDSLLLNKVNTALIGANGGVAPLDAQGHVPEAFLPSYVDDVLEYASKSAFPTTGESGKIYVALDTNLTYRWGGTAYVEISKSLALGHTTDTAFPGNEGLVLQGYFTNGVANDAAKLGGQLPSYYAAASSLSNYLPLTGGTMQGDINMNGYSIVFTDDENGTAQAYGTGGHLFLMAEKSVVLNSFEDILLNTNTEIDGTLKLSDALTGTGATFSNTVKAARFLTSKGLSISDIETGVSSIETTGELLLIANAMSIGTRSDTISMGGGEITVWSNKVYISTAPAYFYYDKDKECLRYTGNLAVDGFVSAGGVSDTSGGGGYDRLDRWADYTGEKATWVLSALLGNDLNTRVSTLEARPVVPDGVLTTSNYASTLGSVYLGISATAANSYKLGGLDSWNYLTTTDAYSKFIPNVGGFITSEYDSPFGLKATGGNGAYMWLMEKGGKAGEYGINANGIPTWRDSDSTESTILHSSNWTSFITIPTTLPASDVYAWAKAATKPSYTTSEVTEGTNLYFTEARAKAVKVDNATNADNSGSLGGVAASSYLLSSTAASTYLPLTGGELKGDLTVKGSVNIDNSLDVAEDLYVGGYLGIYDRTGTSLELGTEDYNDNEAYVVSNKNLLLKANASTTGKITLDAGTVLLKTIAIHEVRTNFTEISTNDVLMINSSRGVSITGGTDSIRMGDGTGIYFSSSAITIGNNATAYFYWDQSNECLHYTGNLAVDGFVSAGGVSDTGGSGGGGLIKTCHTIDEIGWTFNPNDRTDTFNASTIQSIYNDTRRITPAELNAILAIL